MSGLDLVRERASAPPAAAVSRLTGGDTGEAYRVAHPKGDRVVKLAPGASAGLFASEARGLHALSAAGMPVPRVLAVHHDAIVLEYLPEGPPDWTTLGHHLAALHQRRVPAYGGDEPVYLGRYRFEGGIALDPVVHLRDLRLRPLLDEVCRTLGPERTDRLEAWLDRLQLPAEGPCLVHGDLWSGNVHHARSGPHLLDPSAQGAERAYDLAMMKLFGGFPAPFWAAYEARAPVPPAIARSIPAYALVFLLLHVFRFGPSYNDSVDRALAAAY